MKANNFLEIYEAFDPALPLEGEELKNFYVPRKSPVPELIKLLKVRRPHKFLFTGSRGCGKSTELNRLREKAADEGLFIVPFSVKNYLTLFDIEATDVLLVTASQIYNEVKNKVTLDERLVKELDQWSEKVMEQVKEQQKGGEVGVGAGFSGLIGLSGKLGKQVLTRQVIRTVLKPRLDELIENINHLIFEVEDKLERSMVVVIDDLDKVSLQKGEQLFYQHGSELIQPQCRIVYTMPQPLLFSNKIRQIVLSYFDERKQIENISVFRRDGAIDSEGYETMRQVALRRMEESMIEAEALDTAIKNSGGILHEFIRIIRSATNIADTSDNAVTTQQDMERAIADIRDDYRRILKANDHDLLKQVKQNKEKADEEQFMDLLFSLAIIEYSNDEVWYDVHPAVARILE